MTLQPRPNNPIQHRKDQVRKYTRNGVVSVVGGVGGGVVLGFLFANSWFWITLGFVVAVVGGVYSAYKVRQIVNHQDRY